ncbi:MAG: DUF899 domain-containing protein [Acidimicrobiales bacterium]
MTPQIVDRSTWREQRLVLLAEEKAMTRRLDDLAKKRRELPWVKLDDEYVFADSDGPVALTELFGDASQLVIYHFMLGPEWEAGCPSCSFWTDNFNGISAHLGARDISLAFVSRAPVEAIEKYRNRMGWDIRWVSSLANRFNFDFGVSEPTEYNYAPMASPPEEHAGISVFVRGEAGEVFHTYSTYARGLDIVNGAYQLMDLAPKGRNEDDLDFTMAWLHRHDEYPAI